MHRWDSTADLPLSHLPPLEAGCPSSRCPQSQSLVRTHFLACPHLPTPISKHPGPLLVPWHPQPPRSLTPSGSPPPRAHINLIASHSRISWDRGVGGCRGWDAMPNAHVLEEGLAYRYVGEPSLPCPAPHGPRGGPRSLGHGREAGVSESPPSQECPSAAGLRPQGNLLP